MLKNVFKFFCILFFFLILIFVNVCKTTQKKQETKEKHKSVNIYIVNPPLFTYKFVCYFVLAGLIAAAVRVSVFPLWLKYNIYNPVCQALIYKKSKIFFMSQHLYKNINHLYIYMLFPFI